MIEFIVRMRFVFAAIAFLSLGIISLMADGPVVLVDSVDKVRAVKPFPEPKADGKLSTVKSCNYAGYCTEKIIDFCYPIDPAKKLCNSSSNMKSGSVLVRKRKLGVCQPRDFPAVNTGCTVYGKSTLPCSMYEHYNIFELGEDIAANECFFGPICVTVFFADQEVCDLEE